MLVGRSGAGGGLGPCEQVPMWNMDRPLKTVEVSLQST